MSRFIAIAAFALVLTAFAGCVQETKITPPADLPQTVEFKLPELPKIDAKKMLADHNTYVDAFPIRANDGPGHKAVREAMIKEFEAAGLTVWRHTFEQGVHQENICAVKIGVGAPTEWVVVGGHYDTTTNDPSPTDGDGAGAQVSQGAYDDGSGTRITIDLAKAFATIDTYYSVLFCAFDGEERGLQGSKQVFTAMNAGETFPYEVTATRGMLDLDMFGICWPVRAPIYFDANNKVLTAEVDKIRKEMGIPDDMFLNRGASVYVPVVGVSQALGQSDYAAWYNAKEVHIPTGFYISDFSELGVPVPMSGVPTPSVPGAYPWWHDVDTVETMTAMAGSQEMLEKGFQTALDLTVKTFALFALHPELDMSAGKK